MVDGSVHGDRVDRVVCLAVAATGEPVADGLTGGGGLGRGAVAACKRGFAGEACWVADQELGGADRAYARLI